MSREKKGDLKRPDGPVPDGEIRAVLALLWKAAILAEMGQPSLQDLQALLAEAETLEV